MPGGPPLRWDRGRVPGVIGRSAHDEHRTNRISSPPRSSPSGMVLCRRTSRRPVATLRHLYPDSSTRSEAAVLTTWYASSIQAGGSAGQLHLCTPSLGDTASADPFAYYCGTGGTKSGSTTVCAGDLLHTRFTFANYSTDTADDINVRMYLST